AALWPDQLVGSRLARGVALICQSGTIALNLLFNQRSLPIGYLITTGNQTRLAVEDLIDRLVDDPRVTAFGLYVEGIKDAASFARAVDKARTAGKPIALIKAGRTEAAARTAHSHTGSLAGADAAFDAFCRQAGIARCDSLATLCETLKVLHTGGPLRGRRLLVMGASGGDMAMTADAARDLGLGFPPFAPATSRLLGDLLSDRVTIANPFDFHTHIWFDRPRLHSLFSIVQDAGYDAVGLMVDCPPEDQADPASYVAVIEEFLAAHPGPPARAAVISSLPESLSAATRERCLGAAVTPLQGQREALEALGLAATIGAAWARGAAVELRRPRQHDAYGGEPKAGRTVARTLPEHEAKAALAAYGVPIPRSRVVTPDEAAIAARELGFPVVMKAAGAFEHKSDIGGVILDVRTTADAAAAAEQLSRISGALLVEESARDPRQLLGSGGRVGRRTHIEDDTADVGLVLECPGCLHDHGKAELAGGDRGLVGRHDTRSRNRHTVRSEGCFGLVLREGSGNGPAGFRLTPVRIVLAWSTKLHGGASSPGGSDRRGETERFQGLPLSLQGRDCSAQTPLPRSGGKGFRQRADDRRAR